MKKIRSFIFLLLTVLFFCWPLTANASEVSEALMPTLDYDATSQRLTGETVPNANITFSAFVGDIVADDEGKFELPIPAEIKKSQIRIDDYLNNLYVELDFDFATGKIAMPTEISSSSTNLSSSTSSTSQLSSETTKESLTTTEPPTTETTNNSLIFWVLLLVLIVSGTVGGLLYAQKKKNEKINVKKKRRSRQKGRRKKRKASRK